MSVVGGVGKSRAAVELFYSNLRELLQTFTTDTRDRSQVTSRYTDILVVRRWKHVPFLSRETQQFLTLTKLPDFRL